MSSMFDGCEPIKEIPVPESAPVCSEPARVECRHCTIKLPLDGFQCRFDECPQGKPTASKAIDDLGSRLEFGLLNRALRDLEACVEQHTSLPSDPPIPLNSELRAELKGVIVEWFADQKETKPYSFEFICAQLKINSQAVRTIVLDYMRGEVAKLPKLCGQRLTAMDVIVIRLRLDAGDRPKDLGREFKVHPGHISRIKGGLTMQWKHLLSKEELTAYEEWKALQLEAKARKEEEAA
jgi:hypothetical protein